MTFKPAKSKFVFLERFSFVKMSINKVISPGHMYLKSLFKEACESLTKRILMQNNIRIKSAGEGFSSFMTSFKDYMTVLSLFSYLSSLPEYITKQTLSNDLILSLVAYAFLVKVNRPSNNPYFERSSPSRS